MAVNPNTMKARARYLHRLANNEENSDMAELYRTDAVLLHGAAQEIERLRAKERA
jgi:hypothetical protein